MVKAMRGHAAVAGVQEWACAALMNLSGDPRLRSDMLRENAVEAVLSARRAHQNHAKVQSNGALALAWLATPGSVLQSGSGALTSSGRLLAAAM